MPAPVERPPQLAKAEAVPPKPVSEPAGRGGDEDDEELRNILDTAADGIITLDNAGNIRTFSAGAEAIFGYRIAEVLEKPLATLLTQDSRRVLRDYLSALQGPGLATVFNDGREVTAVVKQGGSVPLFLTIGRSLQALISYANHLLGGRENLFCFVETHVQKLNQIID